MIVHQVDGVLLPTPDHMQASAELHEDWTERYRPVTEEALVGNASARKRIIEWVESWSKGIPERRGMLLVGPPGVGKTTIARAIALERGWDVIELNASEERNAAAVRKAATSGAVHGTLFADEKTEHRTILLLDEVDHMAGRLASVSEDRIRDALSTAGEDGGVSISGDTGGKAELLNLLRISQQPVMMACNDVMRFWGMGSGWRERRDRFLRLLDLDQFKRVSGTDMRAVETRLLAAEYRAIEGDALERLVMSNPGDMRALIRDLQSMVTSTDSSLTMQDVDAQISIGGRDGALDLFPGLEKLYRSKTAKQAHATILQLDKDPDQLVAWVSWNNPSVHTSSKAIACKAASLSSADRALPVRFDNRAYRSWYWSSHLSALSAGVHPASSPDKRLFLTFPGFLRRGRESWRKSGIVDKIADKANCSKAAARTELYPLVRAAHDSKICSEWPDRFRISLKHGFGADEHVLLTGLNPAATATKEIAERYQAGVVSDAVSDRIPEMIEPEQDDQDPPSGQKTLF